MQKHERIQYAIEQSGKQKNEIAKLCHVKPPAVTQWTSGPKAIRDMNLFSLARATGFRAEWLSLGIGPMKSPTPEGQMEVIGLISADGPMRDDEVELSYYEQKGDVTGNAKIEFAQIAERKLRFSKEMLEVAGVEISCSGSQTQGTLYGAADLGRLSRGFRYVREAGRRRGNLRL